GSSTSFSSGASSSSTGSPSSSFSSAGGVSSSGGSSVLVCCTRFCNGSLKYTSGFTSTSSLCNSKCTWVPLSSLKIFFPAVPNLSPCATSSPFLTAVSPKLA